MQQAKTAELRKTVLESPEIAEALESLDEDELATIAEYRSADPFRIALAKLKDAYYGVDTDEEAIFKIVTGMSGPDRAKLMLDPFYATLTVGSGLDRDEKALLKEAVETGKIPTGMAMQWAVEGLGTEDEMITQTLAAIDEDGRYLYRLGFFLAEGGKLDPISETADSPSPADISDANSRYAEIKSQLEGDLGGDDLQKAYDQLLGATPTLREMRTAAGRRMAAFIMQKRVGQKGSERESGWNITSTPIVDAFSGSGETADQAHARFRAAYAAAIADGTLSDEELAVLASLDRDFAEKHAEYVATVDQVRNVASTAAAVAVGIIVSVATLGAGTPAATSLLAAYGPAALIGGAAGATAKVGVSEIVGGSHYDTLSTEGLRDAMSGFAEGAMAVLSTGLAARFTALIGLKGPELAVEITQGVLTASNGALAHAGRTAVFAGTKSAIEGFLSGVVGELIMTAADAEVWKQSIWQILQDFGKAILKGGGLGAVTGALTGGTLEALGAYVGARRMQVFLTQLESAGVNGSPAAA